MKNRYVPSILLLCGLLAACNRPLDLSGTWELKLGQQFDDVIILPGTTDLAGKGFASEDTLNTSHLTRLHAYVGKAWYRKQIRVPGRWKEKGLILYLERTKASELYIDSVYVGSCNDVSTPQEYKLGPLAPGSHTLTLCVDNGGGVPDGIIRSSHLYSDDTQTNWNGVIGRMELRPADKPQKQSAASLPRLEIVEGRFQAGGHPVFLRGKHDACVFPHTGHTPMDKASWLDYFQRCREYGINHVRFHSWCPPEAAFAAADQLGIYLQPELPFWGTLEGDELLDFLKKEGLNIVRTYGHHPSFALFSLGNELWGEAGVMQDLVETFRKEAPQILYTNGTNAYLGFQGYVKGMDFQATCRTGWEPYDQYQKHVRSSFGFCDAKDGGILNHFYPGTRRNYAGALDASPIPVISHETGQFQTYPDYAEIEKYTGPLKPYNLMEFRRRLEAAGMGSQAMDFHRASGAWAVELYKADIELCLRTPGLGGFQLLDIQDYPGQGSAYVGILDAFMDSKGLVSAREWRSWCSEMVPLAEFDKYCWSNDEIFRASLKLAKFSEKKLSQLDWSLTRGEEVIACGKAACPEGEGLLDLCDIEIDLSGITDPARLDLNLGENHWPVWVYPAGNEPDKSGIRIVRELDAPTLQALQDGASVLLMPSDTTHTVGALFQTDYWNYRMFKEICQNNGKPVSPGTMGLLMDPSHPLFKEFPTQEHTSWQWFPVVKLSRPHILDAMEGYRPIVQVIDNIERNHRLGLVFEGKVGKGKLLVCCSDLDRACAWPEGRQFYRALLDYMRSGDFAPTADFSLFESQRSGRFPQEGLLVP